MIERKKHRERRKRKRKARSGKNEKEEGKARGKQSTSIMNYRHGAHYELIQNSPKISWDYFDVIYASASLGEVVDIGKLRWSFVWITREFLR